MRSVRLKLVSRWPSRSRAWDKLPAGQRDVRLLEQANAQGWTESPNRDDTWAFGFLSLVCLQPTRRVPRDQVLGCMVVSSLKIMHLSLVRVAPGEPSTIEHAPGAHGRFSHRPLPSCRHVRIQGESMRLQDEELGPGRTYRPRDATPRWCSMDQFHELRAPRPSRASASVQTRNRTKPPDGIEQASP